VLAITVCATKNYTYAMAAQARRVAANCVHLRPEELAVVLVGDGSREVEQIAAIYRQLFEKSRVVVATLPIERDDHTNYKTEAQLLIARMRDEVFARARSLGADQCWSLDSDVLPPANALRCMQDMLAFDCGYYSISTCPYPNSAFLGGFGTAQHPIADDFLPHERKLPPELSAEFEANEAELKRLSQEGKRPPGRSSRNMGGVAAAGWTMRIPASASVPSYLPTGAALAAR